MKKRFLCFMVIVCMMSTIFIGCSNKKVDDDPSAKETTTEETTTEETTIKQTVSDLRVVFRADGSAKPLAEEDRIVDEINRRLWIDLEIEQIAEANWDEKIGVMMASGDLPDVTISKYPSYSTNKWIDEGLVIPISDYFSETPTVKKVMEEKYPWSAINGKYYGYLFMDVQEWSALTLVYRGDYLDNVGMKIPENLDDFYEVMKAFTTGDPDGNGENDTVGYTTTKTFGMSKIPGFFNFVFYAYGMPSLDYSISDDGKIIPGFEDQAFKDGMTYLQKLYSEGLIDPDFVNTNNKGKTNNFYTGKAGSMVVPLFRQYLKHQTKLNQVNPEANLVYSGPPSGPDGSKGMDTNAKSGILSFITSACKTPVKAAKFIELNVSPEGRNLLQNGIEGIHYTKEDGKIVINEEEREKDGFSPNGWAHPLAWANFMYTLTIKYLPEAEPQRDELFKTVDDASKYLMSNLIPVKTMAEVDNEGVLNEIYNKHFLSILIGETGIDEGLKALSNEWRNQGGDFERKGIL